MEDITKYIGFETDEHWRPKESSEVHVLRNVKIPGWSGMKF